MSCPGNGAKDGKVVNPGREVADELMTGQVDSELLQWETLQRNIEKLSRRR